MKMKEYYPRELNMRLSGRTLFYQDVLYLSHAAGFFEFTFTGKRLEAEFLSEGGAEDFKAWVGVYEGDAKQPVRRIALNKGSNWYLLWESDVEKTLKLRIVKLSENQYASVGVKKIRMDENALVSRTFGSEKRIEFIGDSLTCGFGNEGKTGEAFRTETENPLKAYAVLTAQKLQCDFELIAWSGIGVLSSWVEPDCEIPNTGMLLPVVYPYTDYSLYSRMGWEPKELYPYEQNPADMVVLNIGTNDASYTRHDAARKQAFREAYQDFLRVLRQKHTGKPIICTANAMTDMLNEEIEAAVRTIREEDGDSQIYFMLFEPKAEEDGEGAVAHPSLLRHEKMAAQLAEWIQKNVIF